MHQHGPRVCGYYEAWASGRFHLVFLSGSRIDNSFEVEYECHGVPDRKCEEGLVDSERGWQGSSSVFLICNGELKSSGPVGDDCLALEKEHGAKAVDPMLPDAARLDPMKVRWLMRCLGGEEFPTRRK